VALAERTADLDWEAGSDDEGQERAHVEREEDELVDGEPGVEEGRQEEEVERVEHEGGGGVREERERWEERGEARDANRAYTASAGVRSVAHSSSLSSDSIVGEAMACMAVAAQEFTHS
jgi:hypothetical protein